MSIIQLPSEPQPMSDYRKGYLDGIKAACVGFLTFIAMLSCYLWILFKIHAR